MRIIITIAALLLSQSSPIFAATGDTTEDIGEFEGFGSITIQQVSPESLDGVYSEWTLIKPGNKRETGLDESFVIDETKAGNYTIIADIPQGTSAEMELYINGDLIEKVSRQQISFVIYDKDQIRVKILHTLTRTGNVSVSSSPKGLEFTLKGPNHSEFSGVTPASFKDVAEGLYTVYFEAIEDCISPKPKSDRLIKDGRVNLNILVSCEGLEDTDQGKEEAKASQYVTVTVNDNQVTFTDVPTSSWYAPFVHTVAKTGIITGYRDSNGNHSGTFGVTDNVTLAQLSKIAHIVAAIDHEKIHVPVQNTRARGTWFELYYASAEQRWWQAYQNRRDNPSRFATRSEVVVTLHQALDVPRYWPQGKTFSDILPTSTFASSIETAARDGMIAGYEDGTFRPDSPVNRAELAKIVAQAIELYLENSPEISGYDN